MLLYDTCRPMFCSKEPLMLSPPRPYPLPSVSINVLGVSIDGTSTDKTR